MLKLEGAVAIHVEALVQLGMIGVTRTESGIQIGLIPLSCCVTPVGWGKLSITMQMIAGMVSCEVPELSATPDRFVGDDGNTSQEMEAC